MPLPVCKYIRYMAFLSCVAILLLYGCAPVTGTYRDHSGNFINGGKAFSNDGKILFASGAYVYDITGEQKKALQSIEGSIMGLLHMQDQSIYFYGGLRSSESMLRLENGYYQLDTRTQRIEKLLPFRPEGLSHYQDHIYFIHPEYNNGIFRMTSDGEQMTYIGGESVSSMAMDEHYIYYVSGIDLQLYRMRHDGSDRRDLKRTGVMHMMQSKDRIYYKDGYNDYRLTSVNKDGGQRRVLIEDTVFSYNVRDDVLFYSSDEQGGGTYSMDLAQGRSATKTRLFNEIALQINLTSEYMIYLTLQDGTWYRRNLDGTGRVQLPA